MKKAALILLFAVLVSGGAFFRLWRLNDRPMHTDEAVHAVKFCDLLGQHSYRYDPNEFHGPTLNYFTLFSAWLRGEHACDAVSETTLRLTPAVFGILLILTPLLFVRQVGFRAGVFAAVLIAFSPGLIFYSRYYIPEMLLVFFTACLLGCLYNYFQTPRFAWLLLAGMSAGLMHVTKETFVFSIVAAAVALIVGVLSRDIRLRIKVPHLIGALGAMAVTSAVFYSSFGSNPSGILDSVRTYWIWFQRSGTDSVHSHPWYFYLDLLTWLEFFEPICWNEDGIVGFAIIGMLVAFAKAGGRRYRCARFWVIYTMILTVIYSLIPYKTPWCMMSFVYGMALVAGFTMDRVVHTIRGRISSAIVWGLIIVYGLLSPLIQSWLLNFKYDADPGNPYVYAHTSRDIDSMVEAIDAAAQASGDGPATPIYIIAAEDDYWPLPWYLRNYQNVGYWDHVDESACRVPVIVCNAEQEQDLLNVLYSVPEPGQKHLYVPLFDEPLYLRSHVEWRGYIRYDLQQHLQPPATEPDMSASRSKQSIIQPKPDKDTIPNLVKFSHRAMAADFEVFIQEPRGTYAGRAARAAFHEVDRLEALLSRFIDNSDVSRINSLASGESVVVDEHTLKCLQVAQHAWQLTDGLFDPTIGSLIAAWKNNETGTTQTLLADRPSLQKLEIDPGTFSVAVRDEGISLDLGGVAKGYAVDIIAEVLKEWGIDKALIHGGASSIRTLNPPESENGWPVTLIDPIDQSTILQLEMNHEVLSCSGLQGTDAYINPFTGKPGAGAQACWIRMKDNAALADALTTAGMLMSVEQLRQLQEMLPSLSVMVLVTSEKQQPELIQLGAWPTE